MPRSTKKHKVEQSLKYRWGIVGSLLAVCFFVWYVQTSGSQRNADRTLLNENLVKITCIRCNGEAGRVEKCSLCNGYGTMWVDETRKDLSPAVRAMVDEAKRKREQAKE